MQAYEIQALRAEVEKLKTIVTENTGRQTTLIQYNSMDRPAATCSQADLQWIGVGTAQPNQRHSALETIFASIKSASSQEAQIIIRLIRSNHSLESIAASTAKPMAFSSSIPEDEADQEGFVAEKQHPDIMREWEKDSATVAQSKSTSRRVPTKHVSKNRKRTANARSQTKFAMREAQRHRMGKREGTLVEGNA